MPRASRYRLTLIGRFELHRGRTLVVLPPSVERVVAYVALHSGRATRSSVAWTLWPDTPEPRAMANLRSALWRLHRPGIGVIDCIGDHLRLSSQVSVDLRDLAAAARGLVGGALIRDEAVVDRLVTADDILGEWYDDWILVEREHFRQLRLQALEGLAVACAAAGQFARATECALAAIAAEPLRESAHRALIGVHLAQGNHSEAVRQYSIYRRMMREELGLEPSDQMEALLGLPLRRSAEHFGQERRPVGMIG